MGEFQQDISAKRLLELYSGVIYRIAFARTQNKADAEDITQNVFMKYIDANKSFKDEEHRKAWLLRVAINCTNDFVKSAHYRNRASFNEIPDAEVHIEEKSEIYYAVQSLPEKYRLAVHLFYYEDMSFLKFFATFYSSRSCYWWKGDFPAFNYLEDTMKNKKLASIFAASLCACMLLTGWNRSGNANSSGSSLTSGTWTNSTQSGNPSGSMPTYGATISVADIKKAHGTSDGDIMPLYNVEPDEKFDFVFKANWFDKTESLDSTRIVTVHTHPSCSEESMLYTGADIEKNSDGGTKLTISPIGGVLSTDSEDMNMLENDVEVWGNAQMYYIAVWYDTDADSFVKLDKPVVIPFTVKHELSVPTLKWNVDPTGRFKLVWTPVEGADGYNIYWFGNTNINRTGKTNKPVAGAEQAFDVHGDCYSLKKATTEETEFDCFAGKDHGLAISYHDELDADKMDYIIGQNYSVNGSYFVTARFGDKESSLSNIVNTAEHILPHVIMDEDDLMRKHFASEADLPHTVRVLNIDGSVTERTVSYKFHWGTTLIGGKIPQYRYFIENTAIMGLVNMEYLDGKMELYKDKQEGDAPTGHIGTSNNTSVKSEPDNTTPFNPEADVPTIIEAESGADSENKTLAQRQTENTEKHIEKGNAMTVDNSVKLGGEWYQTDCTNNETNCGIPFFLYEAGADDLKITGYTEDKLYELDLAAGRFAVADSEREYYEANGLAAANINEYKTVLASCLDPDRKVTAIRYTGGRVTQDEIVRAVVEVYNMKGMENKLATLGLGAHNSFIILIEK